jgi:hypothetical protein
VPVEPNRADIGRDEPGDDVEAGGLAGAVGAQEADRLAALDRDRDVAQNRPLLEAFAEVAGDQPSIVGDQPDGAARRAPARVRPSTGRRSSG